MKKAKVLWMLLLTCVFSFSVTGCVSKDEDEDNETYKTREYIIGIGKWDTKEVKKTDGSWTDFPFGEGKSFMLEFFDRKNGTSKFKSWEYIGQTDYQTAKTVDYVGEYTVDKKTVTCTVDGEKHLQFVITEMANNVLGGTVTFYKQNVTFDVRMERTW